MPDPAWEAWAESADKHMTLERSPSSHGFNFLHYKERNWFRSANIYWEMAPVLKTQSRTRSSACPSRPGGMMEELAETRTRGTRKFQEPWPEVSLESVLLRPEEGWPLPVCSRKTFCRKGVSKKVSQALLWPEHWPCQGQWSKMGLHRGQAPRKRSLSKTSPLRAPALPSSASEEWGRWPPAHVVSHPQHLPWGDVLPSEKCACPRSLPLSPPLRPAVLLAAGGLTWSLALPGPDLRLVLHGTILISFASHNSPSRLESCIHFADETLKLKGVNWPSSQVSEPEFDSRSLLSEPEN